MKEIKRKIKGYSFFDRTGIEAELTQMAEKGWLIEDISGLSWKYRRIESSKMSFCVTYYPTISEFSAEPTEEQKTFYDFCERSGWKLAAANTQMHIFYNEQENAVPIETDPVLEVENIHRSVKKKQLRDHFIWIIINIIWIMNLVLRMLANPIEFFASNLYLFLFCGYVPLLLFYIVETGRYYLWRSKAKKAALRGEFLETSSRRVFQNIITWLEVIILILCFVSAAIFSSSLNMFTVMILICLFEGFILFFIGYTVTKRLKRKKESAAVIRRFVIIYTVFSIIASTIIGIICMICISVFSTEKVNNNWYTGHMFDVNNLPLAMEDFTNINPAEYTETTSGGETFLLGYFTVEHEPDYETADAENMPRLEYTITSVKTSFMYDMCKNHLLGKHDYTFESQNEATIWGAQEVYLSVSQNDSGEDIYTYLLFYKDYIVEISFNWEVTSEQIAIAAGKLGNV